MDNGIIYEGQFVKGHFHGEGKLVYPNVTLFIYREGSIKLNGMREKWLMVSIFSTIVWGFKLKIGNIVLKMIADSTRSIYMELNHPGPHSKLKKTNLIIYLLAPMILEMAITNPSKVSFTLMRARFLERQVRRRWSS